jgi:hypothetical protein
MEGTVTVSHRLGNHHRRRRRTPSLALLACLSLTAAGCGGGGSSGSAAPASTSPSSPSSPTASASGPAVVPADGRKVDLEAFTARTPQGFDYDNSLAKEIVFSASRDYGTEVTYSDITVYPGTSNGFAARLSVKNSDWNPKPTVADPVSFAGVTWYHLTGPIGKGQHLEEFGSVQSSRLVKVSFEMDGSPAQRKKLVASVLATVHLK